MKFAPLLILLCVPLSCRPTAQDISSGQTAAHRSDTPRADERLQVEATVARVTPGAAWDHHSDGSFEAFDAVTFAISEPDSVQGRELTVYFDPDPLPEDGLVRAPGTRVRFRIEREYLEHPAPGASREIHRGALEDFAALPPALP